MTSRFAPRAASRSWKTQPSWKTGAADRIANAPRPIPAGLVDAVLRYADIEEDMGGGRTLRRLSPARVADLDVQRALGDAAARAGRVSILWNESEGQIIHVLAA